MISGVSIEVAELLVSDQPEPWARAGFTVETDATCHVGAVRIRFAGHGPGTGIIGWALRGAPGVTMPTELDGIPTRPSTAVPAPPAEHPNGVTGIDHIVWMSADLDRSVAALRAVDLQPRRERDAVLGGQPIRQIFYRMGAVILEVVGSPDTRADGAATLWGVTYTVADIDATATFFGDRTSRVKDAVQPGRRITTVRHAEFGMSVRTAMITGSDHGR